MNGEAPDGSIEARMTDLVLEYAVRAPADRPLRADCSLRNEIGLDSFSLVSLVLRIGEEFDVDLGDETSPSGMRVGRIVTFGDLVALGRAVAEGTRPA